MLVLIIVVILICFIFYFSKNSKSDNILREIASCGEKSLTNIEKEGSNILFQMIDTCQNFPESMNEEEPSAFSDAMDFVSLELFKYGMWRLENKKIADYFFKDKFYIKVNQDKFRKDYLIKIGDKSLFNKSENEIDVYVLNWIIKFRDDARVVYDFMNSSVNNDQKKIATLFTEKLLK